MTPDTINISWTGSGATKQIAFLGFHSLEVRNQILTGLRSDSTMYGDRISAAVSKDSADYVQTTSTGKAPPAAPRPPFPHLRVPPAPPAPPAPSAPSAPSQPAAAPALSPPENKASGPVLRSVEVQTSKVLKDIEVQTQMVLPCSWVDQAKELEKEQRKQAKKLKKKEKEKEKEKKEKEAVFMQVKEEVATEVVSPTSCARSPTRSDSSGGLTVIEDEEQRKRNNLMAELNEKETDLKKIKQEIKEEEGSAAASSK